MKKTELTIQRVVIIPAAKVKELVNGWKNAMVGVESNKGFHIAHIHHLEELKEVVGMNVVAKVDTLRNAKVSNINFISIR